MAPITVIIPVSALVKKAVAKRLEAVQRAIRDTYWDCKVVVVEQSLDGELYFLQKLKNNIEKICLEWPVFNKSWCLNVGARLAVKKYPNNKLLVFADADMYCKSYDWDGFYTWFTQQDLKWGFAWNRLVYTNDEQRKEVLGGKELPGAKHETPRRGLSEGGLVCFDRDFFYKIGQFNECIRELGGIDSEVIIRAYNANKTYAMYNKLVYHLWHQQIPKSSRPTRAKNIKIIRRLKQDPMGGIRWLSGQFQGSMHNPLGREYLR